MPTYAEIARTLPVPTAAQSRQFARYVAGAHSWYKHLRMSKGSPFCFYLDPDAGGELVRDREGRATIVAKTEKSEQFHYNWMTTDAHRQSFGHWNYSQEYSPGFQYRSEAGVVDTGGAGLRIRAAGGWIEIPAVLARAGMAMVNALVYWPLHEPAERIDLLHGLQFGLFWIPPAKPNASNWPTAVGKLEAALPGFPVFLSDAVRPLVALWKEAAYCARWSAHWQSYLAHAKTVEGMDTQTYQLLRETTETWRAGEPGSTEIALLRRLAEVLYRERDRQIHGMVQAMNRFVAALHAAPSSRSTS